MIETNSKQTVMAPKTQIPSLRGKYVSEQAKKVKQPLTNLHKSNIVYSSFGT